MSRFISNIFVRETVKEEDKVEEVIKLVIWQSQDI